MNVHLLKDVGMIPYVLFRDYGYDSTLVAFQNEANYFALEKEVKGLKIEYIESDSCYRFGKPSFKVIKYIWNNAPKMDVLNLYHNTKETLLYGLIYKIRNRKGVLYIKLDLNLERFKETLTRFKRIGYSFYFKKIASVVSYELDYVGNYLFSSFPSLSDKFLKITNGIDDQFITDSHIRIFLPDEKENLIIIVGRIGAPEKNHELLLNVLQDINLKDWKVVFIGPIESKFQKFVCSYFTEHPELKSKVIFTGAIYDRQILYSWYNRAKVFCLTSYWESFAIVLVEALYFRNFIITSNVASAMELTNNEQIGRIFRNSNELKLSLQVVINEDVDLFDMYYKIGNYSQNYIWSDILKPLDQRLKQLLR